MTWAQKGGISSLCPTKESYEHAPLDANPQSCLKTRYTGTLEALGKDPSPDSILSAPDSGFGGSKKLQKNPMDKLRGNEARLLKQRAEAMPRDDPRAEAFFVDGKALSLTASP